MHFSTAIHLAAAAAIRSSWSGAERCHGLLAEKAAAWQAILKIGRTHLADATPLALGQEIGGLARQPEGRSRWPRRPSSPAGTAGRRNGRRHGYQYHLDFGRRVAEILARETGTPFVEAADHFEGNAARRPGRVPRPVADHCRHAVRRGQ